MLTNTKGASKLALMLMILAFGRVVLNAATLNVQCNNSSATYSSIGAAVLAANNGDTIKVFGVCTENVLVDKSLTILGPAKLVPGNSGGYGFGVTANNVTISGFDISGFNDGIDVFSVGGSTIKGNTIHGNAGRGIGFFASQNNSVKQNVITRNGGTGIFDYLGAGTYSGNTITYNGGTTNPYGNSGIEISGGAGANITANVIQRNAANGLFVSNARATVTGNDLSWNGLDGFDILNGGNSQASLNFATKNRRYGINAEFTTGASFQRNVALGNSQSDAQDDSSGSGTSGTANTWKLNVCQTSSPAGLCFAF